MAANVSTNLAQLPTEGEHTEEGQPKEAKEEPELENDVEVENDINVEIMQFMEFEVEVETVAKVELEAKAEAEAEQEQEEEEEEVTHMWNNADINAHSTLLTPRPLTDRCTRIDSFYNWLSTKK